MQRAEAEKLVGTRVRTWSAANGIYTGTLTEVVGSPWRGKVLIDGILQVAQHFEMGQACRRGFRVGEMIEVGGVSITPTEEQGVQDYAEALRNAIGQQEAMLERCVDSRHIWSVIGFRDAYQAALECELECQKTGEWNRRAFAAKYLEIKAKNAEKNLSEDV